MSRAVSDRPQKRSRAKPAASFLHLVVGLLEAKKRGSRKSGSLGGYLFGFSLEGVAQVEANAARVLVEERLAVPGALRHRRHGAAVPGDPRLRVVPALEGFVRRRTIEDADSWTWNQRGREIHRVYASVVRGDGALVEQVEGACFKGDGLALAHLDPMSNVEIGLGEPRGAAAIGSAERDVPGGVSGQVNPLAEAINVSGFGNKRTERHAGQVNV